MRAIIVGDIYRDKWARERVPTPVGPFASKESANAWAKTQLPLHGPWHVEELTAPQKSQTMPSAEDCARMVCGMAPDEPNEATGISMSFAFQDMRDAFEAGRREGAEMMRERAAVAVEEMFAASVGRASFYSSAIRALPLTAGDYPETGTPETLDPNYKKD